MKKRVKIWNTKPMTDEEIQELIVYVKELKNKFPNFKAQMGEFRLDIEITANDVIEMFLKTKQQYSEEITLDNLDRARLVYDKNLGVVVGNEHGTRFSVEELSEQELEYFYQILN